MLLTIHTFNEVDQRQLMDIYREGNLENTDFCVGKKNEASIATHLACGFSVADENGYDYLQQETDDGCYGMEYRYTPGKSCEK